MHPTRRLARVTPLVAPALALVLVGCGSGSDDAGTSNEGSGKLSITSPSDGTKVSVPFTLEWTSSVPLGPPDSGKDHVHVYVDGNEDDYTVVGGDSFTVKKLSPGEHELEIALQHADHTPVGPESKVEVTVTGGGSSSTPSDDTGDDSGGGGYGY